MIPSVSQQIEPEGERRKNPRVLVHGALAKLPRVLTSLYVSPNSDCRSLLVLLLGLKT